MNKQRVDERLAQAYEILKTTKIAQNGKIKKGFQRQISSFNASVISGSLLAAVAFFSDEGNSKVERQKLMVAIFALLGNSPEKAGISEGENKLFSYVRERQRQEKGNIWALKEEVLDCSMALKLAMNLYELVD